MELFRLAPPALLGIIRARAQKEEYLLKKIMGNLKIWAVLAVVVVVGGATIGFFALANQAQAEPNDWPPLTMKYNVEVLVNDGSVSQVRQLTYNSRTSWTEQVIEADDITVGVGTFNDVGSYQKVDGGVYTTYDVTTGETLTQAIPDGMVKIPRGGLMPSPISVVEGALGKQADQVATTTKVCFDDDCTERASGWEISNGNSTVVFADDARGIPIKIGDFVVTEVMVQGGKESVTR